MESEGPATQPRDRAPAPHAGSPLVLIAGHASRARRVGQPSGRRPALLVPVHGIKLWPGTSSTSSTEKDKSFRKGRLSTRVSE